jgi:Putative prokaryotic signal transducing protein
MADNADDYDALGLVVVATFDNVAEAHIARGMLDAQGVPSVLADTAILGVLPSIADRVGGVKLQVARRDEQKARDLIEHPPGADEDFEDLTEADW